MGKIVFQPQVMQALSAGAGVVAGALRPTLGPLARTVLVESGFGRAYAPNVLVDGGTIARRLVEIEDRDEDVGAMLLRHALWRVQERAGDGVATTAVIFQAIVQHARAYLASGGSPMRMRDGILMAAETACAALDAQAVELNARELAGDWLAAQCDDRELCAALGQVFRHAGADSFIHVENAYGRGVEYEFLVGSMWLGGWHQSPCRAEEMTAHPAIRLHDVRVLVSDLDLSNKANLQPLVMCLARLKPARLLVICRKTSPALHTLFTQARQQNIGEAVFVKVPNLTGPDRGAVLQDIALLTGASFIPYVEPHDPRANGQGDGQGAPVDLNQFLPHCLGRAGAAWATGDYFGIESGRGDKLRLRDQIAMLERRLEQETEPGAIKLLRERITRLHGGSTILRIGAPTDAAQKHRRDQAERLIRLAAQALRHGVVPGAGAALLACQPAVRALRQQRDDADWRMATECVALALEAPLRVMAANAGLTPACVVHETRNAPPGHGFELVSQSMIDLRSAGILDSLVALKTALRAAASAAAMLLTTDVIVHRHIPRSEFNVKP
jgi:chaperonin GroEL